MLSPDNEAEFSSHKTATLRRPSAVSQILRKISESMDLDPAVWDVSSEDETSQCFRLRIAADRALRTRAYALAHRVYQASGLAAGELPLVVSSYDADPQTFTILVEDERGEDAATISVVVDSPAGLPADEIYKSELAAARDKGRVLCEVTRLAIAPEHKHSRHLLVRLFNFVYVYARRIVGADDFIIEVHPRHAAYYHRLLKFEPIGPVKPCPRVQNSLSVLLGLKLAESDRLIRLYGNRRSLGAAEKERSLYPFFYRWLEEGAVAEFIARRWRPMSDDDVTFFHLSRRPSVAVPVE
jgi:hypothetical protein